MLICLRLTVYENVFALSESD